MEVWGDTGGAGGWGWGRNGVAGGWEWGGGAAEVGNGDGRGGVGEVGDGIGVTGIGVAVERLPCRFIARCCALNSPTPVLSDDARRQPPRPGVKGYVAV